MRTKTFPILALLLLIAACASTQKGRELQLAKGIVAANDTIVTALDFDIIDADTGEALQAVTRVATADLKRGITARRAGRGQEDVDRILALVRDALLEVTRILAEKGGS